MTVIIDLETDSTDPETANLKFFGGLDVETGEVTIFDHTKNEQIKDYVKKHKIIIGFNFKAYDQPILERFGCDFKFKILVDLWECLAPKGDNGFGIYNKDRLHDINPSLILKNYKLKTIVEILGLDNEGNKGDFDYSLYKKEELSLEERKLSDEYLTQDLKLEFKVFEWYSGIFKPLKPYLPKKDFNNYKHLTCTSGSLAYKVVCYLTNQQEEYNDKETARELKRISKKIEGGHHIHARWSKVKGKIICRDFVSHYPTTLIQYNLLESDQKNALYKLLSERLKAKSSGDEQKALALKVPLNSVYGILGNPTFKNFFNPSSASDCTRIGRELLKRYAKTLDIAGFSCLYGFTDSVYVGVPSWFSENDLEETTNHFIQTEKTKAPNPIDSFGLGIDKELKFMWFLKDNNYLWVDNKNKIGIKGGLFDINCPKCITRVFEDYISPKIIKDLDVNFSSEELLKVLKEILNNAPELSAEDYNVKDLNSYTSKTSIQYQISERYGAGIHSLIPNKAGIGIGRNEDIKYCSLTEFKEHNLNFDSIHIDRMMRYLKPFYSFPELAKNVDEILNEVQNA